jgi:hypothetical protein
MPTFGGDFNAPELGSKPGATPSLSPNPAYVLNRGVVEEKVPGTPGAAMQYAEQILGGPLFEIDSNPTANSPVAVMVDGNGDRVALVVINLGAQIVQIGLTGDLGPSKGIVVGPSGGSVSMILRDDYTLVTRRWYMFSNTGPSSLYVLELVRFGYTVK